MTDTEICQDIATNGCGLFSCIGERFTRMKNPGVPCPLHVDDKECGYLSMDDVKKATAEWLEKHKEKI